MSKIFKLNVSFSLPISKLRLVLIFNNFNVIDKLLIPIIRNWFSTVFCLASNVYLFSFWYWLIPIWSWKGIDYFLAPINSLSRAGFASIPPEGWTTIGIWCTRFWNYVELFWNSLDNAPSSIVFYLENESGSRCTRY